MGLIELLYRYNNRDKFKRGHAFIKLYATGQCDLYEPVSGDEFLCFNYPEQLRDYLVKETADSNTEDKVYL